MEVKDWAPGGRESITTPGRPFRPPAGASDKTYSFTRATAPNLKAPVKPAPITEAQQTPVSPFSREAAPQPWYAKVEAENAAAAQNAAGPVPAQPVQVLSHDGENPAPVLCQQVPGGPQIYTIQLPPAPRAPAAAKRSLWWVFPALIAALLLGLLLGMVLGDSSGGNRPAVPTETAGKADARVDAAQIYRENVSSVVGVSAASPRSAPDPGFQNASVGTGFLISQDGYLLTNAHVIRNAEAITVTLSDGSQLPASVVAVEDMTSDIALLKIDGHGLHAVTLGDSAAVQVGDWVCTIGNPLGELNSSLAAGWLSAGLRQVDTGERTLRMLQLNLSINKGNSGGPLFDSEGRVIGMVTAKLSAAEGETAVEGVSFALPINEIMDFARGNSPAG